ncbi:conserved hypothetical protein [Ricinus communis]|uniref:Uncharacterized protein n=1 Tax=Ricinus communis TaxID=3988 RepID=B9RHK3_RICCO|nr:conserved hypothetical protein [Ricinus communis]
MSVLLVICIYKVKVYALEKIQDYKMGSKCPIDLEIEKTCKKANKKNKKEQMANESDAVLAA